MTAGSTYSQIATTTLGSAAASYTFSSIPQTYTNLVIVYNGKYASANGQMGVQINGDTGTNYSNTFLYGSGSAVSSGRDTGNTGMVLGFTASANVDNMVLLQFINYSNAKTFKTVLSRSNTATSGGVSANVGLWRNTSAITSIKLYVYPSYNFVAGSTFTLYGIKGA
jgi:hypothetical protein